MENCLAAERRDISSLSNVFIGKRSKNKGGNTLVIKTSERRVPAASRRTHVGGTYLLTALSIVLAVRQKIKNAFRSEDRWGVRMVRE